MDKVLRFYKKYKKAIIPAVAMVGVTVNSAITDNTITGDEWKAIGITVVTAVWVYGVKNEEPPVEDDEPLDVSHDFYLH